MVVNLCFETWGVWLSIRIADLALNLHFNQTYKEILILNSSLRVFKTTNNNSYCTFNTVQPRDMN